MSDAPMSQALTSTRADLAEYVVRWADDALVSAQRLAEWCSWAPEMEEDIALTNLALDQLGTARSLLTYVGELDGTGRDEDTLAYLRGDSEFRNCLLAELPNGGPQAPPGAGGDFAMSMARLLFVAVYQHIGYQHLSASADVRLAEIAAKAAKESAYHVDHASLWTVRLGDGTEYSHARMQDAVEQLWPYTHELFSDDEVTGRLAAAAIAPLPSSIRPQWLETVDMVFAEATLDRPADGWAPDGGRTGQHTEHLSYLLGEMQVLHRAHPGVRW